MLYIVGSVDIRLIKEFKRTNSFEENDYIKVANYIEKFDVRVTTPNILTETSNFLGQINNQRDLCFYVLKESISMMEEKYTPSIEISKDPSFIKFGLTDSSIAQTAKDKYAVFTADLGLLESRKLKSIVNARKSKIISYSLSAISYSEEKTLTCSE